MSNFDHYKHLPHHHENWVAYSSIELAYAMARHYRAIWVENELQTDEVTLAMMPFAVQIFTSNYGKLEIS
jgi:hypothetical protein